MKLRQYQSKDCGGMSELFYDTVHTVNRRDYTEEQVCAWADGHVDPDVWNRSFLEHFTVIAEDNGTLVGFGDMAKDGYLDRLYVHRDHQGKGIGRALWEYLLQNSDNRRFTVNSSPAAVDFYHALGFADLDTEQLRGGIRYTPMQFER